jgi:hypothetical protein
VSGRSHYRKTGAADDFWRRFKERLMATPPITTAGDTVVHFTLVEGNGVIGIADIYLANTGLVLGRCYWRVGRTPTKNSSNCPSTSAAPIRRIVRLSRPAFSPPANHTHANSS